MRTTAIFALALLLAGGCHAARRQGVLQVPDTIFVYDREGVNVDSLGRTFIVIDNDTLHTSFLPRPEQLKHSGPLTEKDFEEIARELDVETAAIRAIVDIETGHTHRGFNDNGKPIINFDLAVFKRNAQKRKINLGKHSKSEALQPINISKYGNQQTAQHARLDAAMKIDAKTAIESTFWGMFQIGGFNWQLCGASSPEEFMELMSRSDFDQLQLFANFIRNTGLLPHLKKKNWAAFSRIYNGPSYAKRGYHTRMAAAYRKYSK